MKEDLSSAIIDSMSDGLLVLNSRGYITHINPAALDKLQVSQEEISVKTYFDLFMDEPQNDDFNDILFEGIQKRKTRHYGEVTFLRRDGKVLDLAVTTSFLKESMDDEGNHSIVMVFKDITELKSLDRARARVLAHLSHELKTPPVNHHGFRQDSGKSGKKKGHGKDLPQSGTIGGDSVGGGGHRQRQAP